MTQQIEGIRIHQMDWAQLDATVANAIYAKTIRNTQFKEIKQHAASLIRKEADLIQNEMLPSRQGFADAPRMSEAVSEFYYGSPNDLHQMKSFAKKIAKATPEIKCERWYPKALAMVERWALIVASMEVLKTVIVKGRQSAPIDPRTIENTGTCACCGQNHKRDARGNLVRHGYTVRWGTFNGDCFGVGYKPNEVSPDCLFAMRESLISEVIHQKNAVARYESMPEAQLTAQLFSVIASQRNRKKFPEWREDQSREYRAAKIQSHKQELKFAKTSLERTSKRITEWKPEVLPDGNRAHLDQKVGEA